jgi:hypothetical protein
VRQFFTDNALYWLMEYRVDGLRLDAVQMIFRPTVFNGQVPALDVTGFSQTAMNPRDNLLPRCERTASRFCDRQYELRNYSPLCGGMTRV